MSLPLPSSELKRATSAITPRERRPVSLLTSLRVGSERPVEVLLLDLSRNGCGIETPVPLQPGWAVTIVQDRQSVEAEVCWYANCRAGLRFKDDYPGSQPRRREVRTGFVAEASVRRLGANKYRVRVHDLSPSGCKIELVERPRIGEHILIKFDGLEALNARVCWLDGFIAGVSFDKAIHPAVLDLLLAKAKR